MHAHESGQGRQILLLEIIMGIAIQQYRACIRLFNKCKYTSTTIPSANGLLVSVCLLTLTFVVIILLLLSGDIEPNPGPNPTKLSICHANVRGLKLNEMLDIKASLATLYDIICIMETHLHAESTVELSIKGY